MKKIIAIIALATLCNIQVQAQEGKTSVQTEVAAGQKFLGLDQSKTQTLTALLEYKAKIKNDPKSSDKMKKELPWMIEKKMEGFLSKDEMTKLRSNKELFQQLTN